MKVGGGISDSPSSGFDFNLSYDVASGSEITPCNKIDTGNVMTSAKRLQRNLNVL